ncbi:DUF7537 family lipoprotein [Haloarchaeobius sp. TZWWS8]|uniref:DUF7537 family lipoprotein n=1 Tax=Haloarchaeobius sp. TZWWS8 TaxID=3446121 RepID=UPI003EB936CF
MKAIASVAVVALVVLGGCVGSIGTIDSANAETTAYPPGVSASGIDDLDALLAAHEEVLYSNGYELTIGVETTTKDETTTAGTTVLSTADGAFLLTGTESGGENSFERVVYSADETAYERLTTDGETVYSGYNVEAVYDELSGYDLLTGVLGAVPYEVESSNGGTTVLTASDVNIGTDQNVVTASSTVTVRDDGLVESLKTTIESDSGDDATKTTITLSVKTGDVAVSEPAWVSSKRSEMTIAQLSFEVRENAIVVTHQGGDAIPAGTQFVAEFVTAEGETDAIVGVFDGEFTSGQTATVYNEEDVFTTIHLGSHEKPTGAAAIDGDVRVALYNGAQTVETAYVSNEK